MISYAGICVYRLSNASPIANELTYYPATKLCSRILPVLSKRSSPVKDFFFYLIEKCNVFVRTYMSDRIITESVLLNDMPFKQRCVHWPQHNPFHNYLWTFMDKLERNVWFIVSPSSALISELSFCYSEWKTKCMQRASLPCYSNICRVMID